MSFADEVPPEAAGAKPMSDFAAIPKGDYPAVVIKYERKEATPEQVAGTGPVYHKFTFQILDGDFKNRQVTRNIYFSHPDPEKRGKSQSAYKSLKVATGMTADPANANEFCNRPLLLSIGCFLDKETKEPRNAVNNIKPRTTGPTMPAGNTQVPGASAPAANANPFGATA